MNIIIKSAGTYIVEYNGYATAQGENAFAYWVTLDNQEIINLTGTNETLRDSYNYIEKIEADGERLIFSLDDGSNGVASSELSILIKIYKID